MEVRPAAVCPFLALPSVDPSDARSGLGLVAVPVVPTTQLATNPLGRAAPGHRLATTRDDCWRSVISSHPPHGALWRREKVVCPICTGLGLLSAGPRDALAGGW